MRQTSFIKGAFKGEPSVKNDKISTLEQKINKLVYNLYDLNENAIKLIEKKREKAKQNKSPCKRDKPKIP